MRLITGLIRFIFLMLGLLVVGLVAAFVLITGTLFMLISGKRPQVRVFRPQGFGGRAPEEGPFYQPPMKDVTPQPAERLNSQS